MKDIDVFYAPADEKPLDNMVSDGGFCGIFRTIACIGDSLSSGEFESRKADGTKGYHDCFDYSWGQYMARMAGCKVYNFSRGGMTAEEYVENFADNNNLWSTDKLAQAYIIALGVNDIFGRHSELGSVSDIDTENYENNAKTFAGYYGKIISKYKKIQPRAKFFLVAPPRCDDPERNLDGDKICALLYKIAGLFDNVYVIDLCKFGPVHDEDFEKKYYLGGHMNPMGYLLTARIMCSYIDYIIRHNMEDFRKVGFIGTSYDCEETEI